LKKVILGSIIVTLAATPWINSDALIIPKIIALVALASYFLPSLVGNYQSLFKENKILVLVSILFIAQMLAVILKSDAPWEQQFFGRTGRGLGFITYFSLLIVMIYVARIIKFLDLSKISLGLLISCSLSSTYSIFQFFGIDFSDWRTATNGIIGTIGNPNFQSSFAAIAFIPSITYLWSRKSRLILIPAVLSLLLFTLYICESTQGYIALLTSIMIFILIYMWYINHRLIFYITLLSTFFVGLTAIAGMLNKGPLSYYLYKVSVQSRGEMWDTATSIIKDNPMFGIGLDSLGDYSLAYRSEKTANGIAEYIDNCHNFLLQFAATGGVFLALTYLGIMLLTFYSFFMIQKRIGKFNMNLSALFAAWVSFQLQSIISPAAIPTLLWNFIICGAIVGLNSNFRSDENTPKNSNSVSIKSFESSTIKALGVFSLLISLTITYPLFNADKLARQADINKDALLAVKAAKMYPESVIIYSRLGIGLYESGLYDLSLDIARSAVKFNPNSYQTWILILVNPNAAIEERIKAKKELIRIDPFNKLIQNYKI
jgi:O-antigen ligase